MWDLVENHEDRFSRNEAQPGSKEHLEVGHEKDYFQCVYPVKTIRILHECEVLIGKSVPKVTVWHHYENTPM